MEAYEGCDILDLFPGAGLWTQKVNRLLKPAIHVLHEVEEDQFAPFLQALQDEAPSTYVYKNFEKLDRVYRRQRRTVYQNLDQYYDVSPHDTNPTPRPLVVLVTLSRIPYRLDAGGTFMEGDSMSTRESPSDDFFKVIIEDVARRACEGKRTRPIRVLAWVLNNDKFNYLPHSVLGITGSAGEIAEAFTVQEIVSAYPSPERKENIREWRPARVTLASAMVVAERMRKSDISLPDRRQSPLHQFASRQAEAKAMGGVGASSLQRDLERLDYLDIGLVLDSLPRRPPKTTGMTRRLVNSTYFDESLRLQEQFTHTVGTKVQPLTETTWRKIILHLCLVELERSIALKQSTHSLIHANATAAGGFAFMPPNESGASDRVVTMEDLIAMIEMPNKGMSNRHHKLSVHHADNILAYRRSPPVLRWDQRLSEPVASFPEDFWPQHTLALLDFQLRDDFPTPIRSPDGTLQTGSLSRVPLVQSLRRFASYTLVAALDSTAHGAATALIPQCPSITDPLRGGRLAVEYLTVRMLTEEMWRELAEAWYRWPFHADDSTLLRRVGFGRGTHDGIQDP